MIGPEELQRKIVEQTKRADDASLSELAAIFAVQLNSDPNTQALLAREFVSLPLSLVEGSEQAALEPVMTQLLCAEVKLEIRSTFVGEGNWKQRMYIFGETARFSFSSEALTCDPLAYACMARMIRSGYSVAGRRFFRKRSMTTDRTEDFCSNAGTYNAVFSQHFNRVAWLVAFVRQLLADAIIISADRKERDYRADCWLLVSAALRAVSGRLEQRLALEMSEGAPRCHWLNNRLLNELGELVDICARFEAFTCESLDKLFEQIISRQAAIDKL